MPKKMTKAEIEAARAHALQSIERLRKLAEKAQAELDRRKQRAR